MAENSFIGWCHHTHNFWMGCDKVAPECSHCYIDRFLGRMGLEAFGHVYRTKSTWANPMCWQKACEAAGTYARVFTCSLSDFFHVDADGWRPEAWQVIKDTPNLIWLVLSKRPELIAKR